MNNEIGVIATLRPEGPSLKEVADFGLKCCQLVSWKPEFWTAERAARVRAESAATGVRITAFWAGWPGPATSRATTVPLRFPDRHVLPPSRVT